MRPGLQFRTVALAASSVCTVALATILSLLPVTQTKTIWSGYRVLAVPLDLDESEIITRLTDSGIRDFATESNSAVLNDSKMAPSQPFLAKKNAELSAWFVDRERGTRFAYLRDGPFLDDRVERAFSSAAFSMYLERAGTTGPLPLLLLCAYLVALGVFSTQKRTFLAATVPFLLFAAKCPDAASFCSAACAVFGLFLLAELLEPERKALPGRYRSLRLRRQPLYALPFAASVAFAAVAGAQGFLRFSATLALSASFSVMIASLSARIASRFERKRLHPSFTPDFMHPDTLGRKRVDRTSFLLAIPVPCLLVASLFMLGTAGPSRPTGASGAENDPLRVLYIPSPSGYTSGSGFGADEYSSAIGMREAGCVPDLAWFISVRWNLETAPWRRLDEEPQDPKPGTVSKVVDYEPDGDSKLRAVEKNMGTFDSSFIKKVVAARPTPLERMLTEQGRFVTVIPTRHTR